MTEIVTEVHIYCQHPEIKHGKFVAFGPDEEIGRGAIYRRRALACDFAYTMDGGPVGELE